MPLFYPSHEEVNTNDGSLEQGLAVTRSRGMRPLWIPFLTLTIPTVSLVILLGQQVCLSFYWFLLLLLSACWSNINLPFISFFLTIFPSTSTSTSTFPDGRRFRIIDPNHHLVYSILYNSHSTPLAIKSQEEEHCNAQLHILDFLGKLLPRIEFVVLERQCCGEIRSLLRVLWVHVSHQGELS